MIHTEGHVAGITGISFPKGKDEIFATIDDSGFIYVWDNNEINVITKCSSGTMQRSKVYIYNYYYIYYI